ncbi:energy-coupling factor ABC transporter ATP-binding protein [Bacillus rubiinfantis]|uniref:energy-coupling factor ABC transporter ATP-binding protein n=1 Tax=Bacillus rubiinfantis TaxID=1499680 RepID=UPI0005AA2430|nr:ATP-binding cassette domain-containing protein [Bacillus rubiinfantis]
MKKIIVNGLKYQYPQADVRALNDISFEVEQGEFIGIIGKNSSGKSTLCQSLVGLVPHFYKGAYGGEILVDGLEVKNHPISEIALKVGIVFQNPFTQISGSKLTVYDEIAFGLENIGLPPAEMHERITEVLKELDIEDIKDHSPFTLSGGQMQRLAIASIMAMKPEILVLDEPTSQLDPAGSEEVFKTIAELSRQGVTVMMAEHNMEKIAQFSNRVMLLHEGRLIDYDTPEKIFSRVDLADFGVEPPVYTTVCKALNIKKNGSDVYPVTLAEAEMLLRGTQR